MDRDNGAANLDTGEVRTPSGGNSSVEQVCSNPLIWKKIGSYLNMEDLLTCRLVNSEFHAMVMKETDFLKRCLVSLEPNQITRSFFGSTSEPWRNVLLEFGNPGGEGSTTNFRFDEEELEWLYPILSNVECLRLRMKLGTKVGGFYPVLRRLLNAPKKLRALAIEPIFLSDRAEDIEVWKDTFKDLEGFEVLDPPCGWHKDSENLRTMYFPFNSVLFAFSCKMKNIQVLINNCFMCVCAACKVEPVQARIKCFSWLPILLSRIASGSTNTLKFVTYPEVGLSDEDRPGGLLGFFSFPLLESAAFCLSKRCPTEMIRDYFLALPMLKRLDFTARMPLPNSILSVIAERSDQLRTLKILSLKFEGTSWQFLKNTKIEEFSLGLLKYGETVTLPDEALNCLPSTIKRLRLFGPLASNPVSALARLNPSLVREIKFVDSGDCFTDDTMQYIRENFKMLRVLRVVNAKRVTDVGFVASSESGALSEIKGLKKLTLKGCGSITDATLREIRFLELSYLNLSENKGVTYKGYENVLENNPSFLAVMKHMGKVPM